ncbi:DUF3955 domain-containing protein [Clostridium sp. MSJ-4]|uniref:DUF3955 domain-containing protein n=1 Tax=Clostridium simiarum TaxID=2841506 RepID=A0ABS6EVG1_9CLOT|nr:DUF3955 domain-containing protein [Clostridium simiarum]MBU5590222.1 DUF3955 domain-containing protein [Clostridium simiarum]
MKKYTFSLISLIISFGCIAAYGIIGSKVAPDGTLIEPFFLIPMFWLFALIAAISALIVKVCPFFYKSKKHSNN